MRLAFRSAVVALTILAASAESTYTICSPTSCSNVSSNVYKQLALGAHLPETDVLLLPGTYTISLPEGLLNNSTIPVSSSDLPILAPLYNITAFQNYTVSTRVSPFSLRLFPTQGVLFYSSSIGTGNTQLFQTGATIEQNQTVRVGSWVLGNNVWAKLKVNNQEIVSWDSVGHVKQLPLTRATDKSETVSVEVLDIQSAACNITCSSGGSCVSLSPAGENSACVCRLGFTGSLCDLCSPGYFGKDCQDCAGSCTSGVCSDGLNGTGNCVASTVNSTTTCYCLNGECQGSSLSSSCRCSAGWTSPIITSSAPTYNLTNLQCSTCAAGFILSSDQCVACPKNSLSCKSPSVATACVDGWEIELGECVRASGPSGKGSVCEGNNYWSTSSKLCEPCSPLCDGCFAADQNSCLACPGSKKLLRSTCVSVDETTGICQDTDSPIVKGSFYYDSSKEECDSCPSKSLSCAIPGYNASTSVRSQLVETGCISGWALSVEGKCVESCPNGEFTNEVGANVTCSACDTSCGTCQYSSSYCLTCPSNSSKVAYNVASPATRLVEVASAHQAPNVSPARWRPTSSLLRKILSISLPILLACLSIILLSIWLYVRRERRKTKQATLIFAEGLDDVQVDKQKRKLGVENVLRVMRRARQTMEDRWADQDQRPEERKRSKKGTTAKYLKPLRLETGWRNQVGFKKQGRRNHPPPYTPLPTDTIFLSHISSSQTSNGDRQSQGLSRNDSRYFPDSPTDARFIIASSSPTSSDHTIESPRGSLTSRYTFESDRPEPRYTSTESSRPYSSEPRCIVDSKILAKTRNLRGTDLEDRTVEDEGVATYSPAYRVSDFIDLYLRQLEPMPMPKSAMTSTLKFNNRSNIAPPIPALFRDHLPPPHAPTKGALSNQTIPSASHRPTPGLKIIPRKPFGPSPTKSKTVSAATSTSKFIEGDDSECGWSPDDDRSVKNVKPVLNSLRSFKHLARSPTRSGHYISTESNPKRTEWMINEKNEGGREDLSITFGRTDVSSASALISGFGIGWDGPDTSTTGKPAMGSNNPFRNAR
ncbi:Subtilisin-like proprotein convertase [Phaffia rhodozyma]|uniref:Subtilisin-like proprotein convertase n=1 Tax=Phaffia rhodozyma TaxID=264483 RepID=A0A0F7STU1_PHARH|nr:Subtilisin-like proprotein convertase [Phaffia rhodozyma]